MGRLQNEDSQKLGGSYQDTCHLRGWRRILSPRKQESLMQARGVKLQRVGMGGRYVDRKCKLATAILAQRNKNCCLQLCMAQGGVGASKG